MRIANQKTGEVKRIKPNGPCHCGSGLKFKKCCLPGIYRQAQIEREIMNDELTEAGGPKLSNEYRDGLDKTERDPVEVEAEKVGEAAMMLRDMRATMRSLQVTKMVTAMDRAHTEAAIRVYSEFIDDLAHLPISEATRDIGLGIGKQLVQLKKSAEVSQLTRASEVMLAALEEVMGENLGAEVNEAGDEKLEAALGIGHDALEESLGETAESLEGSDEDESLEGSDEDESLDDELDSGDTI